VAEELRSWITFTQKRYVLDDVERQWKAHNPENKDTITWEDYRKLVYGFIDGNNLI
jgi:calumenin